MWREFGSGGFSGVSGRPLWQIVREEKQHGARSSRRPTSESAAWFTQRRAISLSVLCDWLPIMKQLALWGAQTDSCFDWCAPMQSVSLRVSVQHKPAHWKSSNLETLKHWGLLVGIYMDGLMHLEDIKCIQWLIFGHFTLQTWLYSHRKFQSYLHSGVFSSVFHLFYFIFSLLKSFFCENLLFGSLWRPSHLNTPPLSILALPVYSRS